MAVEGAIKRQQTHILNLTLPEQQPIKRITGCRLRLDGCQHMLRIDYQHHQTHTFDEFGEESLRHAQRKLAESHLNSDFPKAGDASMIYCCW